MRKIIFLTKDYLLLIFLLLVSLFLISIDNSPAASKPKSLFFGAFAFLNSVTNNLFVEPIRISSESKSATLAAKLNLQNERLRLMGLENAELKRMLNYAENSKARLITARIIGKDLSPTKSNLIIDKGEDEGVKTGMSVITAEGFLGLVTEVSGGYSIVRTYENGLMKITVEVERNGINGLVTWDGKNLVMKNIPTNYDIKKGDRIITSPFSLRFAHYIPLGLVKEKLTTVSGLFADLIIQPFNDVRTARFCFVIENSDTTLLNKINRLK